MSGHTRLWWRGATCYFRAKVPKYLLKHSTPKKEIKFSLDTKKHAEAIERLHIESFKLDKEFAARGNGASLAPVIDRSRPKRQQLSPDAKRHNLPWSGHRKYCLMARKTVECECPLVSSTNKATNMLMSWANSKLRSHGGE